MMKNIVSELLKPKRHVKTRVEVPDLGLDEQSKTLSTEQILSVACKVLDRDILEKTCEDFREMQPNQENNFCCGAGGGLMNCGSIWKHARSTGSSELAGQMKSTNAKTVITPCSNCYHELSEIINEHQFEMETKFLCELLFETCL